MNCEEPRTELRQDILQQHSASLLKREFKMLNKEEQKELKKHSKESSNRRHGGGDQDEQKQLGRSSRVIDEEEEQHQMEAQSVRSGASQGSKVSRGTNGRFDGESIMMNGISFVLNGMAKGKQSYRCKNCEG